MATFSLTNINFGKNSRNLTGPINSLFQTGYNYNILRYPIDVGNYDKGHYMVFHINTQNRTQFTPAGFSGQKPTSVENAINQDKPNLGSNLPTVLVDGIQTIASNLGETAQQVAQAGKKVFEGASGLSGTNRVITRTTKQTTETIALYMPDTLNFTYNQTYSDVSLGGGLGGALLTGGGTAIADLIQSLRSGQGIDETLKRLGNQAPAITDIGAGIAATELGGRFGQVFVAAGLERAINPLLELLYTSPSLRQFRFDFLFYPRSEKEAQEVQKILNKLRFHQAPEIDRKTSGFFLIPPSEFDIKFYYNGTENPNIPRISTCVLETIDIDYAPNGFSAYELPNALTPSEGGTGMPVAIRLSLQFKETEIMTKSNFAESGQGIDTSINDAESAKFARQGI